MFIDEDGSLTQPISSSLSSDIKYPATITPYKNTLDR